MAQVPGAAGKYAPLIIKTKGLLIGRLLGMNQIDQLRDDVTASIQELKGALADAVLPNGTAIADALFAFGSSAVRATLTIAKEPNDKRRIQLPTKAIQRGDIATTIFALIIACLLGLNTKYLGFRAFRTIKDYADLFLWGAATKATLDIVTSVLDKISTSQQSVSSCVSQQLGQLNYVSRRLRRDRIHQQFAGQTCSGGLPSPLLALASSARCSPGIELLLGEAFNHRRGDAAGVGRIRA